MKMFVQNMNVGTLGGETAKNPVSSAFMAQVSWFIKYQVHKVYLPSLPDVLFLYSETSKAKTRSYLSMEKLWMKIMHCHNAAALFT